MQELLKIEHVLLKFMNGMHVFQVRTWLININWSSDASDEVADTHPGNFSTV